MIYSGVLPYGEFLFDLFLVFIYAFLGPRLGRPLWNFIFIVTYCYGGTLVPQGLLKHEHLLQVFIILMSTDKNIADAGSTYSHIAKEGSAIKLIFEIPDQETEVDRDDRTEISIKKTVRGQ